MKRGVVGFVFLVALVASSIHPYGAAYDGRLGYTSWECSYYRPSAWVRATLILEDPNLAIEIAEHEVKHVEQMLRHKSCSAYKAAWWSNPDSVSFEMEAEAFCAHARAEVEKTRTQSTLEGAIARHAHTLSTKYFLGVSMDSAKARISHYCREALDRQQVQPR